MGQTPIRIHLRLGSIPVCEFLPNCRRGPNHPSVLASCCPQYWKLSMNFGPNVPPRRGNETFPIKSLAQSQSASDNDSFGIEHVDQLSDRATQRFGSGLDYISGIDVSLAGRHEHFFTAFG